VTEIGHMSSAQPRSTGATALIRILLLVIALGVPLAVAREYLIPFANSHVMAFPDANTYLAAGERLNAGHELFRWQPGDRQVLFGDQFPAALLSPPPIAVLWRPLAAVPWGFDAWVVASWVALLGTIAYLVLKTGLPAVVLSLALSIVIGQQLIVANARPLFPAVLVTRGTSGTSRGSAWGGADLCDQVHADRDDWLDDRYPDGG
jgi:hypothetical protein